MAKIKDIARGTIITPADNNGQEYILLEPATGLFMAKQKYQNMKFDNDGNSNFDPLKDGTLAFYINRAVQWFPQHFQDALVDFDWGIGALTMQDAGVQGYGTPLPIPQMRAKELSVTVRAKIGLLSVSQWRTHAKAPEYGGVNGVIDKPTDAIRLITQVNPTGLFSVTSSYNGLIQPGSVVNEYHYSNSAFYIDPETDYTGGIFKVNKAPILTLSTTDARMLYENDTYNVNGTTQDLDLGDIVAVKYQINDYAIRTIESSISAGATIPFDKNLTYKDGKVFDGSVAVSDTLAQGIDHTLKVWAEDDKSGKSTERTRTFRVVPNRPPSITLETLNNQTFYENDKLAIKGNGKDLDAGDVLTVKYQIDTGMVRNLHSAVSDGAKLILFSKDLTFTQGILKDGDIALTSVMDKDAPHTLAVWIEDSKGGRSAVVTRTFYVAPNRPPTLTVNPIAAQSKLINSNIIQVNGTVGDLDNNDVVVTFQINDRAPQEVFTGKPGAWNFNILLNNLELGANTLVIKAKDIYDAEISKVLIVHKTHNATPVKQAIALYKISPPTGSAQKILLWIERMLGDLSVTAEVSMTNDGEAENFVPLPRTNSELKGGLQEDEFAYQTAAAKTNIVVKIIYNRNNSTAFETIKRISGVLS